MSKYTDSKIRHATFEGNTPTDRALDIWQTMTPMERAEVMGKVRDYRSIDRKFRACINYIADELVVA